MSEYKGNSIQGWMNDADLQWLYETAKTMDSIVEIGSWKGKSTHALLSGCNGQVYAVDTFLGSPDEMKYYKEVATRDIHKVFMDNVGHFPNLNVIKTDSMFAAKRFKDNSIDMVFIDGSHVYDEVVSDIKAWYPKAKNLICGHDWTRSDVREAVRDTLGTKVERVKGGIIWLIKKI